MAAHADSLGARAEFRVCRKAYAMIAVTHNTSGKTSGLERHLVRAFVVHLRLKYVAVRTYVLYRVYSWWGGAMISVTGWTGRCAQISTNCHRFVVHAPVVAGVLVRRDAVSLHVVGVGVTPGTGLRHIHWADFGARVARGSQVVNAMAFDADGNLGVSL